MACVMDFYAVAQCEGGSYLLAFARGVPSRAISKCAVVRDFSGVWGLISISFRAVVTSPAASLAIHYHYIKILEI